MEIVMKHLLIYFLWHVLDEIVLAIDAGAVFDYHWIWKLYPKKHVMWCVKNYGSIKSAKRALLW